MEVARHARRADAGHAAFARVEDAVVDDDVRLQPAQERFQVACVFLRPPVDPFAVEPQHLDIGLLHQLAQLGLHVAHVARLLRRVDQGRAELAGLAFALRRIVPVHDRVVHAEVQALAAHRLGQRRDA